jgi:hypothetical protein
VGAYLIKYCVGYPTGYGLLYDRIVPTSNIEEEEKEGDATSNIGRRRKRRMMQQQDDDEEKFSAERYTCWYQ